MREQHTLSIVDDQKRLQTEPNRPPVARHARPPRIKQDCLPGTMPSTKCALTVHQPA